MSWRRAFNTWHVWVIVLLDKLYVGGKGGCSRCGITGGASSPSATNTGRVTTSIAVIAPDHCDDDGFFFMRNNFRTSNLWVAPTLLFVSVDPLAALTRTQHILSLIIGWWHPHITVYEPSLVLVEALVGSAPTWTARENSEGSQGWQAQAPASLVHVRCGVGRAPRSVPSSLGRR
jgi:hypothetical protein